jgi:hypothetical protein
MSKASALDRFLKNHHNYCTIHRFSDSPRVCSCGRDDAQKELENLRNEKSFKARKVMPQLRGRLVPPSRVGRIQRAYNGAGVVYPLS